MVFFNARPITFFIQMRNVFQMLWATNKDNTFYFIILFMLQTFDQAVKIKLSLLLAVSVQDNYIVILANCITPLSSREVKDVKYCHYRLEYVGL